MIVVPGGSFTMGSPDTEPGRRENEGPQQKVEVAAFAAGRFEVTVGEFRAFVTATGYRAGTVCDVNPSNGNAWRSLPGYDWQNPGMTGHQQSDRDPVGCASWFDAKAYVAWLSQKTGKSYRLLTEAEFEYAARAGSTTAYPWGSDANLGCSSANGGDITAGQSTWWRSDWPPYLRCNDGSLYAAPVGSFQPNAFGLYDMIGNEWEWVEDCYTEPYVPTHGPSDVDQACGNRVIRGGSWANSVPNLRSSLRFPAGPDERDNTTGFRVAKTLYVGS